jgi:hypothetical protein
MKKIAVIAALLVILFLLAARAAPLQEQHEVVVTNVSVPLRVFEGDRFVSDLSLSDFELYEDGKIQDIRALYLLHQGRIERMDAERDYMPLPARHFYFIFQILEFNPKITQGVEYFFEHVYAPGDTVVVQTPLKTYTLSPDRASRTPKETLVKDMQTVIRRDAHTGAMEYNSLLKDLKRMVRAISSLEGGMGGAMTDLESSGGVGLNSLQFLLPRYRDTLQKMEEIRLIDEKWILRFASQLKRLDVQKVAYFFYEREFRPEIQTSILNQITSNYHDDANIMGQIQDLFQVYHRELALDSTRLERAFADAAVLFNFFFINRKPESISGVHMQEQSEDVFAVFSDVARATGGVVDNSQNPEAAFRKTAEATEFCYLLYYSPKDFVPDGSFRTIAVKVKDQDYRIVHRLGYFAD